MSIAIFESIKFYFNRLFSSKYKLTGKCNGCGECCRRILMSYNGANVKTENEFEELKRIDKKYSHFFISGSDQSGNLLFTCKSLKDDNKCKDYFFRSLYCRKYPNPDKNFILSGGELLETCGYKISVTKKFSDYLD